jgi:hypothetical protein
MSVFSTNMPFVIQVAGDPACVTHVGQGFAKHPLRLWWSLLSDIVQIVRWVKHLSVFLGYRFDADHIFGARRWRHSQPADIHLAHGYDHRYWDDRV